MEQMELFEKAPGMMNHITHHDGCECFVKKMEELQSKLAKAREALSKIESLTFSWVMTKENAEDILLVVAPIRDAVRKTREEIKL
jgi:hypothetical protein